MKAAATASADQEVFSDIEQITALLSPLYISLLCALNDGLSLLREVFLQKWK